MPIEGEIGRRDILARHVFTSIDEELRELEDQMGPLREPKVLQGPQNAVTVFDGKKVINFSANNYLGLATHPKLKKAAAQAMEKFGVAVCSGRRDSGSTELHLELEKRVAAFQRSETALVLLSNSEANWAVSTALLSKGDVAIVDEASHESMIDGITVSNADCKKYRHVDMNSLRENLRSAAEAGYGRVLVSTCGVFPRIGDIAPLPQILEESREYRAITMLDDAHSVGVLGDHGRGTASHFNVEGQFDIQVGGFSKAPGVIGGYIACSHKIKELILRKSNQWRHTQPLPAPVIAACLASLDLLESEEGEKLIQRAWENSSFFRTGLHELGYVIPDESKTPLVPIILKNTKQAFQLSEALFQEGIYIVFKNRNSLRAIVTAGHTREDLATAIDAFKKAGSDLGIITGA